MQLAREATNNDPALRPFVHYFAHAVLDIKLAMRMRTVALAVSRLVHEQQKAFFLGNLANPVKVKLLAIHWILFNTPVAARQDITYRCAHYHGCCIRNRVINPHQLDAK